MAAELTGGREAREATPPGRERACGDGVRHIPLLRSFTLFHASQIEGIGPCRLPTPDEAPWRTPEAVDVIVANSGAVVRYGGSRAFYSVATDRIQLPWKATFRSAGALAGTTLHELAHWSGAGHRLGRNLTGEVGSEAYAREECRAEMAACLASAELGIEDVEFDNSAAYVADWLADLRRDKKEVFRAAADAQRIADYLLAFHPDWAARNGKAGSADGSAAEGAEKGAPLREAA